MYQLIDHIFYDGRHLFEQGEQALRLREKPPGSHQSSFGVSPGSLALVGEIWEKKHGFSPWNIMKLDYHACSDQT